MCNASIMKSIDKDYKFYINLCYSKRKRKAYDIDLRRLVGRTRKKNVCGSHRYQVRQ